jgi:FAD/FMN-containing dehydrogenase/Fe-S oxidoreductase
MARSDPGAWDTSVQTLDIERPDVPAYSGFATALREEVSGDVQFDEYSQILYATDGSIYQARPAGVVLPRTVEDVQATVRLAREHEVPILPRGTGSSLAGQAVGPGCVVMDFTKYMDDLVEIDPEAKRATVQPGIVQDHLDAALGEHGLKFAPDPASSNRATVGGGIGNNSTGAHSVRYGITDAYTEELQVVLVNGELIHTREVVLDSEEYEEIVSGEGMEAEIYKTVRQLVEDNQDEIDDKYPSLKRSVSGYNLHKVIYENEDGEEVINLSKLFVGAEGTLGVIVEATVSLVTKPDETALALYCFDTLIEALEAVPEALEFPVSAVELMDDEVFRLAAESEGYAEYAEPIPEGTAATLMLEWDNELIPGDGDQRAAFESAIADTNAHFVDEGDAFDVLEAYTDEDQADIWKLRKAAIPLLMSLEGDPKPYPFIEDATVPPGELAEYVGKFEDVLTDHDTSAAYFAHAGSGTLHIRPILNLKDGEDIEKMHSITDDVTDLVLEHHGAFSGEHGDGMARTEFNPKMYGEDLWHAFKEVKTAFDPEWLMHPGNVVYRSGVDDPGPNNDRGVGADNREHLRYGASYQSIEPMTDLDFDDEGGFSQLVELCNGCGTCRQTDSDVMCPTYRASKEEIQATRGRANMLRAAISGELPYEEIHSERFQSEVLDLCVGCKGCKSDCPTGVDLAKLKAEVKHEHHREHGSSMRSKLFGNIDSFAALGSKFAPISNIAPKLPGARVVMEKTLGIARDRELPTFERQSLEEWFEARGGSTVPEGQADAKVVFFPDTFTNYSYLEPGKAAIEVLEAANIHVQIPDELAPSGRAAFSLGYLDDAEEHARTNVDVLAPPVDDGWSVVFVEPSDAVMFQDEYLDLLDGENVQKVSAAAYGIMEYFDGMDIDAKLDFDGVDEELTYHGHCNQKATNKDHHAVGVLRRAGYAVDPLDSSCCGMAGSFGYEEEHYEISKGIGQILFDQVEESSGDTVTAPGASCRSQLGDREGETKPPHPVEKLAEAVDSSSVR